MASTAVAEQVFFDPESDSSSGSGTVAHDQVLSDNAKLLAEHTVYGLLMLQRLGVDISKNCLNAVSYTHLTLPTICSV